MPQSYNILDCLKESNCKQFIINNIDGDVQKMALQHHGKVDFDLRSCLEYIRIHQKARKKLPGLCHVFGAMTDRAYQQCTSERVARYRATLMGGDRLLDLSGGLGSDDLALSNSFASIYSIDPDEALNEQFRYNAKLLNISNVSRIDGRAEEMDVSGYDWIFIDPDRRPDHRGRKLALKDLQPDVPAILRRLSKGQKAAVKLSPLFDIEALFRQVEGLSDVIVISEDDEVKEVLAMVGPKSGDTGVAAVNLGKNPYSVRARMADRATRALNAELGKFLYLPMAALIKSGLSDHYALSLGLESVGSSGLYTSADALECAGFRTLELVHNMPPSTRRWKQFLKDKQVRAVRIRVKGHAKKPAEWAKELGVNEGGDNYLILLLGEQQVGLYGRLLG